VADLIVRAMRRQRRLLGKCLGVLGAVLLTGCATYVAKPISAVSSASTLATRTLDDPQLLEYVKRRLRRSEGAAPTVRWDLASLTYAAFYFNPDLALARAKQEVSEAGVITAAQSPNPTLQLPFTYATNPKPGDKAYTLGLGLDVPIETGGKREHRIDEARELSLASQLDVRQAAWQVRSRLRAALLQLYDADERMRILERQADAQRSVVAMLEKRLNVGAISQPDVALARAALDRDRLDLAKANLAAGAAMSAVARALGVPVAAVRHVTIDLGEFASVPLVPRPSSVQELALRNRPDILAGLARYEASQAALQVEIANQYPDIHLGPGYTYDAGVNKFSVGIAGIALPVLNRNEGPIAEAEARRRQAAREFEAVQASVIADAYAAVQAFGDAAAALRTSESVVAVERERLAGERDALAAGEGDRLAVALAEQDVEATALAREDALMRTQAAAGRLEDAMERPLSSPARPIIGEPF